MRVYSNITNELDVISRNELFRMSTFPFTFKKLGTINSNYVPSGTLVKNPSKKLVFIIQKQIKNHGNK